MAEYFMPISELAKKLDVPAHTLRYWEKEFPSLIAPTTGAGGRRYYRNTTVDSAVALKKYLYADGYTIDGVKKLIAGGKFSTSPVESKSAPSAEYKKSDLDSAIKLLKEAKAILEGD
ncbi:MAG: MerR family transcriptional regulator [Rickettsiales bacterium]|jgi:DNA-binding transcriptional MerR regulator|nr:MerR family transcriptional regulator [Rickettsiales bacterium]